MKLLQVRVKPRARSSALEAPGEDGVWRASLKSPPVDGKANAELIELFARRLGVPRSAVQIKSGAGGRTKWVQVEER